MSAETTTYTAKDYKGRLPPVWCPGCGDFGVLAAMQRALAEKQIAPENTVFISGIGCSSRFPHFMNAYGFHSCHGRALPVATGTSLVAPDGVKVLAVGGDGDGMAIGGGHFLHAARRNIDVTYVMMDNEIYGLTKGQISPTTEQGLASKSTPYMSKEASSDKPLNPLALAITAGATFVARGYSGKMKELVEIIGKAIDHPGYAFVQVISPCVTFHDIYEKARAEQKALNPEHDTSDQMAALVASMGEPFITGVFYDTERQTLREAVDGQVAAAQPGREKGLGAVALEILAKAQA